MYKKMEPVDVPSENQRYGSIESLLKSHSQFHIEWKYLMEKGRKLHASSRCLSLAAGCIYKILVEKNV